MYLPYGYSEDKEYNIFYLMHGGWSNETSTFGTPDNPSNFKNVMDHAIQNGEIEPLIIVCPTYNNTSSQDSSNFSLALTLTRNYHNELLNDLIPAAESTYSTYARSTSADDLKASRDHRGFGGFSMGSVATWRTFQYGLDYFHYFLPMSCGTTLDDETIFSAAENYSQKDYFVFMMTGTNDFAYSYDNSRADKMRDSEYFTESDSEQNGNFAYRIKEGYSHNGFAASEYTYNGLKWFWKSSDKVTTGTETYQDFTLGNVLHTKDNGDIHYNLYVPESYDGSEPYALYFTLPGYGGLYFQGIGANLRNEAFALEAKKYNDKMIIVAPQLNDWRETSANQTIALVKYFLRNYNIDHSRIYANGYSGGGETMSLVMGKRPDLFSAYLHCSSQWDGDYEILVKSRTPVYLVVVENDEYYGADPTQKSYDTLYSLYKDVGLTEEEIHELLVLDIKEHSYFTKQGMTNEHGGGGLFA
ncbi:MAG: prolyl oligopeptidase family serine peptidase [Lachnospiraceae bacterium]